MRTCSWDILPEARRHRLDLDSLEEMKKSTVSLQYPFKDRLVDMRHVIQGASNGLICLTKTESQVFLWNPCIHKFWRVPPASLPHQDVTHQQGFDEIVICYGFGYVDTDDDYKVVRLLKLNKRSYIPSHSSFETSHQEAKIYSLKSNCWRNVEGIPYFLADRQGNDPGHLANNAVHWIMCNMHDSMHSPLSKSDVIVGIDLSREKYHLVPEPPGLCKEKSWELGVLDGCLSVVSGDDFSQFEMWLMKDYGVKDSWIGQTIQISIPRGLISQKGRNFAPIAFAGKPTAMLFWKGKYLMRYDTEKQSAETTYITKASASNMKDGFYFVGSLVNPVQMAAKENGTKRTPKKRARVKTRTIVSIVRSCKMQKV